MRPDQLAAVERQEAIPTIALVEMMTGGHAELVERAQQLFPGSAILETVLRCSTDEETQIKTLEVLSRVVPAHLTGRPRLLRGIEILQKARERLDWRVLGPRETMTELESRLDGMIAHLRGLLGRHQ